MKELFLTKFGSHLYGTNTPDSDQDFKGVSIPFAYDIVMQKAFRSMHQSTKGQREAKNTRDDVESEIFSLHQFIKLCDEGQTVALDMLFSPEGFWLKSSDEWRFIVENRQCLIHRKASAFIGYCVTQASKYGIKGSRVNAVKEVIEVVEDFASSKILYKMSDIFESLQGRLGGHDHIKFIEMDSPGGVGETKKIRGIEVCDKQYQEGVTIKYLLDQLRKLDERYGLRARQAATNQGVDWKSLSHALRVCQEAKELLQTGHITFPRPEAEFLVKVKTGRFPYAEVAECLEEQMAEVKAAEATSILPEEICRSFWNEWVFRIYSQEIAQSELNMRCGLAVSRVVAAEIQSGTAILTGSQNQSKAVIITDLEDK